MLCKASRLRGFFFSVMFGLFPYRHIRPWAEHLFLDSRAKHGNDRGEEKNTGMTSCGQLERNIGCGTKLCRSALLSACISWASALCLWMSGSRPNMTGKNKNPNMTKRKTSPAMTILFFLCLTFNIVAFLRKIKPASGTVDFCRNLRYIIYRCGC